MDRVPSAILWALRVWGACGTQPRRGKANIPIYVSILVMFQAQRRLPFTYSHHRFWFGIFSFSRTDDEGDGRVNLQENIDPVGNVECILSTICFANSCVRRDTRISAVSITYLPGTSLEIGWTIIWRSAWVRCCKETTAKINKEKYEYENGCLIILEVNPLTCS